MRKRLDDGRRDELLDGVMRIIVVRGFSKVQVSEIARELNCSASTLYKIAPSKESLVLLAIERWSGDAFESLEARASQCGDASDRARTYFRAGAKALRPMSLAFFSDVERFQSTRMVWRQTVVDRYIDRFVELVQDAEKAGEIRPVNVRFLGEVLRQIGFATRDEAVLSASELTSEQAVLEADAIIWDGIRLR